MISAKASGVFDALLCQSSALEWLWRVAGVKRNRKEMGLPCNALVFPSHVSCESVLLCSQSGKP